MHEVVNRGEPKRLDAFLAERLSAYSRTFLQRIIEEGLVSVTPLEREVKSSVRVPTGALVRITIPPPRKSDLRPVDLPVKILFQDEHIAVIDKSPDISVHAAPGQTTPTLVNALLFHIHDLSGIGGEERPGIVHRLDRETSGLLVVAKHDQAHQRVASQFKNRTTSKTYRAIVRGETMLPEGVVDLPLGKSPVDIKKQVVRLDEGGREARTRFRVLESFRGYHYVEVYPETGRTHQIRVHLGHLGNTVACDKVYSRQRRIRRSELEGRAADPSEPPLIARQALHAFQLSLDHPVTGERLTFEAPVPEDMEALLSALRELAALP